jgi:hypothetical protein
MSEKKQTALQMLIADLEEQANTCPMKDRKFYIYCKTLAIQKLEMEREQIIENHAWLLSGVMDEESARENAEEYFKQTYGE